MCVRLFYLASIFSGKYWAGKTKHHSTYMYDQSMNWNFVLINCNYSQIFSLKCSWHNTVCTWYVKKGKPGWNQDYTIQSKATHMLPLKCSDWHIVLICVSWLKPKALRKYSTCITPLVIIQDMLHVHVAKTGCELFLCMPVQPLHVVMLCQRLSCVVRYQALAHFYFTKRACQGPGNELKSYIPALSPTSSSFSPLSITLWMFCWTMPFTWCVHVCVRKVTT